MTPSHRRHDISDRVWNLLEPHLPERKGIWGWRAGELKIIANLLMLFFWILRTGAPWRDLPARIMAAGEIRTVALSDGETKAIWEKLLEELVDAPDYEWLMIDATHIKAHPHAADAKGGDHEMSCSKGVSIQVYIWPWMRMVCRSESLLQMVPQQIVRKLQN